jgi:hypothetical protein
MRLAFQRLPFFARTHLFAFVGFLVLLSCTHSFNDVRGRFVSSKQRYGTPGTVLGAQISEWLRGIALIGSVILLFWFACIGVRCLLKAIIDLTDFTAG